MNKNTLISIFLATVAMMWTNTVSAQVVIANKWYSTTCDITGEGITGKVHYDNNTKTLTFDNAHIEYVETVFESYDDGLTMVVKGNCSMTMTSTTPYSSFDAHLPMTITGGGTLTINGSGQAISCDRDNGAITIDDCTVVANGGRNSISGRENSTLIVRNATVKATCLTYPTIVGWGDIKLEGCKITAPAGAAFDASLGGVALNGTLVKGEVVISKGATGIASPTVDMHAKKCGVYNLQGVRLGDSPDRLPAGIYIVDGRKVVKK